MRALIVDADVLARLRTAEALSETGFTTVEIACSSGEGLVRVRHDPPDVVIVSADLEQQSAGVRLARKLTAEFDMPCVLTVTPESTVPNDATSFAKTEVAAISEVAKTHAKRRRARK